MAMDAYIIYGGEGFSQGITHMLEASELACFAEPKTDNILDLFSSSNTKECDIYRNKPLFDF